MSSSRAEARLTWLVLLLSAVAAGWLVVRAKQAPHVVRPAPNLLAAVPPGPALLVTADVEALGEAAALELLRAGGSALLGLRETCGFEPLLGLRQVALAVPVAEPGQAPDFAVIAQTALDPEPVLRCAEAVIKKRGGVPVRSSLGDFRSVRDQQKPVGEMAIRADGLFVLSGGQYFRDVVDAASGRYVGSAAAKARAAQHASVRARLGRSQLVVSALPGPVLSLPGVDALGIGLEVRTDVQLNGFVECASVADCREAHQLLVGVLEAAASEPELAALRGLKARLDQTRIHVSGTLPRQQLGPLMTQLLAP
jgi:hypothetical protein